MGNRYRENGDGWDSMCRAADKLSLINGFSPGHLISLALSLKSNLTLCMSVNINKPSTLHSNVIYCVAHGARQGSQFDGEDGSSVCLKWGQRGEKSRQILLSFQTFIKTEQVWKSPDSKAHYIQWGCKEAQYSISPFLIYIFYLFHTLL